MPDDIQIIGLAELDKALEQAGTRGLDVLRKQLRMSGLEMEAAAKEELTSVGGVDVGHLRAATRYRARRALSAEVTAPNPEAAAVEFGTAPAGKLKQHFPPPSALEGWAHRHGFSGPDAGFLVARAIALRGIRARPWLSKAHDTIAPKFLHDLQAHLNALLDSLK